MESLVQADCRDFLRSIPANSVHAVITDPPYGIHGMDDGWSAKDLAERAANSKAKGLVVGGMGVGMKFSTKQGPRLQAFLRPVFKLCLAATVPGGWLVSFSQPRLLPWMALAAADAGYEIRNINSWQHEGGQGKAFTQYHFVRRMSIPQEEKDALIASMDGCKTPQFRPEEESILVAQKPREGTFVENWMKWRTGLVKLDFGGRQQGSVFRFDKPKEGTPHPSVKPVDLMERLFEVFTLPGQTVVDPFVGSGTTAIAAKRTGRAFLGCELDEGYVRLAQQRVEDADMPEPPTLVEWLTAYFDSMPWLRLEAAA
jgi:DNA modification methylase